MEQIRQLESMGFSADRARHALNATDNNVERAAELLLLGAAGENDNGDVNVAVQVAAPLRLNGNRGNANNNTRSEGQHVAAHNDEQIRRAIEESLMVNQAEENRQLCQAEVASLNNNTDAVRRKNASSAAEVVDLTNDDDGDDANKQRAQQKKQKNKQQPRSAAAVNAGKAAAARTNNNLTTSKATLDHTHPNVKIPEKLQNKSKEEQIMRCVNRVKPHVMAVDTLLRVLTSVRSSPNTVKFRTIDRSNANYVAHVRDKPGAEDLLLAMNYRRVQNELRLEKHLVDDALLYLGISALEQMRESEEYKEGKKWRAFHAEMRRVATQSGSHAMQQDGMTANETDVRLEFLSKCPKEPPEGRGAVMNVYLGEENEKIEGGYVSRRFDGDDTLDDAMNWLGGCYGRELLDKIKTREWCLCDLNRYPKLPLDVEKHGNKTLQYLGLFPSGKMGVRLSEDSWKDGDDAVGLDVHGSARGLGAASRLMLH
eukprot:scaffold67_cov192-Alexandrium_tamarense.AAC.20